MKKSILLSGIVAIVCLASFVKISFTKKPADLAKDLIGEWRNVYLKITLHSKNKPTATTMEADSSNWEQRIGIKPIRTHYLKDGTYYSEYLNLKDSVVRKPTGIWTIKGDSLFMTQLTPNKATYHFHLTINKDRATFTGIIDFDAEGVNNDEYYGVQKRFGK